MTIAAAMDSIASKLFPENRSLCSTACALAFGVGENEESSLLSSAPSDDTGDNGVISNKDVVKIMDVQNSDANAPSPPALQSETVSTTNPSQDAQDNKDDNHEGDLNTEKNLNATTTRSSSLQNETSDDRDTFQDALVDNFQKNVNDEDDDDSFFKLDCPICLDPMSEADHAHPLQCTRRCGYNFCLTCIQSLILSSKDDYMLASDGNQHVKIFLHCPNCRSDLSETIRDTVLLRRADGVLLCIQQQKAMTPPQLRMQRAMQEDNEVNRTLVEARQREAEFFGRQLQEQLQQEEQLQEVPEQHHDHEEWGVEVDLFNGAHESFRFPVPPVEEAPKMTRKLLVDETLFQGMAYFMSESEEEYVTDLMTSGDPMELANAAEMLREVVERISNGGTSHRARASRRCSRRQSMERRGSVFELVAEAKRAREHNDRKNRVSEYIPSAQKKAAEHRRLELQLREEAEYLRLHPLPVRMPKCVELPLSDPTTDHSFPLTFCDDIWDGTVMDAFCKISIGRGNRIFKKETKNMGVRNILDGDGPVRIDLDKPRVLVASVKGEGGKQGVMKGDVVTHLNGEEFRGDANELVAWIRSFANSYGPDTTFKLVLNAERATAEALKRRSMV